MKYNLETKDDRKSFFMSKNVSPVIKCIIGRKQAKTKLKREAAIKAKQDNRQKQILRNKEFYNIAPNSLNEEKLFECHSLSNFSKGNNRMVPKLHIYRMS